MKKILILLLLLGGFFRFYHVNWDSYGAFHPDERNISWAVTRIHFFSQMNPKFFAYGGLPIYLYRALGEGVVGITHNPEWLYDWGHIAVIGRYVSATLSTLSILLIFFVASSYFSPAAGLISACFLAFSPWSIQQAHFSTTETMLVFYILLLLLVAKKMTGKRVLLLGLVWGLALAAKTTSILFGLIPLSAIWFGHTPKKFIKKLLYTFLLGTIAVFIFFCFSPYTLMDLTHFRESMTYESGVALGRFTVPYTLQFMHTTPYLYQLTTMLWQAGPLVLLGIIGLFSMVVQIFRHLKSKRSLFYILCTLFPLLYFGWVGSWFAKFNRYNIPVLPFITIAAAWGCVMLIKRYRVSGLIVTGFLLVSTFLWGLANFSVYLHPQTRISASEWVATHVPQTATIYTEHWNDGLPIDLHNGLIYHRELLTVYDEDNAAKKIYYADKLVSGDYIILSTRRMWATMPRLGEKYPLTKVFYERLLDGKLGFTEVATFTSYPQLFGLVVNDDGAEESLQVFDHPTVRIFQNTKRYTREQLLKLLTP